LVGQVAGRELVWDGTGIETVGEGWLREGCDIDRVGAAWRQARPLKAR
jgi:hypothetical protein